MLVVLLAFLTPAMRQLELGGDVAAMLGLRVERAG